MSYNILIAGVGGQGTILTSRILAQAAMDTGHFVRTGETIGMSQRGGCVVSHVRIDSEEDSPYVPLGGADLVIAFEYAEAARSLDRLKPNGTMIVNTQMMKPVTVTLGGMPYDREAIRKALPDALEIDGYGLALQAGNVKAVNVVLLGAALGTGELPFDKEELRAAMLKLVPERYRNLNEKALELGCNYVG